MPSADALAADSFIKSHPKWKFVFVNHVTTNPFFVPTHLRHPGRLLALRVLLPVDGIDRHPTSVEMVNAMNAGIAQKADGIAVCLVSLTAFNGPTDRALGKGIPVLSYNADAPNKRLAYIGQDLYLSGYNMGQRIVDLVGSGDVALFIATPGQLNIQPRIDGAIAAIKKFGKGKIKTTTTATGALLPDELAKIEAYYLGHKSLKGMFAVDYGSTQGIGQVMAKYGLAKKGVKAGGYDLGPPVLKAVQAGHLDFTIDQQPYLQGWIPLLQFFFYKYASGLVAPSDTNTGMPVRDEVQREAVPHDEDSVRRQLQQAEVSGHAKGLSGAGGRKSPTSPATTRRLRPARCCCARPSPRGEHPRHPDRPRRLLLPRHRSVLADGTAPRSSRSSRPRSRSSPPAR